MPVISIAKMTGRHVTAIDDREQFVQNALTMAQMRVSAWALKRLWQIYRAKMDTYFIIVTRGHKYDTECLMSIVRKPHAYIGMIGSRRKVSLVRDALATWECLREVIDSVHMPIGLRAYRAETPEEISVSIMAELIEVKNRDKRNCGFTPEVMNALQAEGRDSAVLATIISKQGSSPRAPGARMLAGRDGIIAGTIEHGICRGKGKIEGDKNLFLK